jgi:hypothetical protein
LPEGHSCPFHISSGPLGGSEYTPALAAPRQTRMSAPPGGPPQSSATPQVMFADYFLAGERAIRGSIRGDGSRPELPVKLHLYPGSPCGGVRDGPSWMARESKCC